MKRRNVIGGVFAAGLLASLTTGCFAGDPVAYDVESRFGKILKNTKVTSLKESPVKGLYEVTAGPNIFYYSPEGDGHLVFGQIVDKTGKNLTAEVQGKLRAEFQAEADKRAMELLKEAPLDKAIKVGNGPNIIIEFTDIDCPYCRKVDNFLANRTDITRYVFLNPIDQLHPLARAKSIFVLNSEDKGKALHEVFSGKFDKGGLPISNADFPKYAAEVERLEAGMAYGQKIGVRGTPHLFVNGQVVNGADFNKIQQLLKTSPQQSGNKGKE